MRTGKSTVLLVFNKRLDAQSTAEKSRYMFTPRLQISRAEVDGNLVRLSTAPMQAGKRYRLTIRDISDDPSTRWLPDTPAVKLQEQTVNL